MSLGFDGNPSVNDKYSDEQNETSLQIQIHDVKETLQEEGLEEQQVSEEKKSDDMDKRSDDKEINIARRLFLKGLRLERAGDLYAAIQFYRQAVQLIPDIELRLEKAKRYKDNHQEDKISATSNNDVPMHPIQKDYVFDADTSVGLHLTKLNETHISVLPPKIILNILRWVVSADLDVRSLEMCSQVCRGFYDCARTSEIWETACIRTWGVNCGSLSFWYPTWRNMFINRPRLQFSGCYINKIKYVRPGEDGFKPNRPWHDVTYYRYWRFFPEGVVLMLVTSKGPKQCLAKLRSRNPKDDEILSGHFRLKENIVIVFINSADQVYHLELRIRDKNGRKHIGLEWSWYSIFAKTKEGTKRKCTLELERSKFPTLYFSRVKSYISESENPL